MHKDVSLIMEVLNDYKSALEHHLKEINKELLNSRVSYKRKSELFLERNEVDKDIAKTKKAILAIKVLQ